MLLNNHRFIVAIFVFPLLLLICFRGVTFGESIDVVAQKASRSLLKSLTYDKNPKTRLLLIQWAEYLKKVSTFSNRDYTEAIYVLQEEYSHTLEQLKNCLHHEKSIRKNYDPTWLNQLIEHFGVANLRNKEKSIDAIIEMNAAGSQENCCGESMEQIFFKEPILYRAYKDYFNLFLDYYKNLPSTAQIALKSRKDNVNDFLELIDDHSIVGMFLTSDLHSKTLTEIQAKNYDHVIYNYFKNHPLGCDIDAFRAIDDFKRRVMMQGN
jgi:hypothetical protein